MGQRITGFLMAFLLIFSGDVFAQENLPEKQLFSLTQLSKFQSTHKSLVAQFSLQKFIRATDCTAVTRFTLLNIHQASYSPAQLGFFCKKELQIEKVLAIPLRFRLGSLDYVNWMERKPNAILQR